MRSKSSLALWVVSLCLFIAAATSASAAPPSDACSLLTKSQISKVVGTDMADGSHTANFSKMCMWAPAGGQNQTFQNVTLNLQSADSYQTSKSMLQAIANSPRNKGSITMTPASGIGDDAYFSSTGSYTKLIVKKGATVFQLVIYSSAPIEKKRAMEKSLALQAISKL